MTERANGDTAGALLAGRYRLDEPIAGGGMGEVWRATDTLLQRTVAVKLLREQLADDPVVSERFRREALVAAQLSHPNMAGVYDYVDNGRRGIVMEYVDGETLAQRLAREGRFDVPEAIKIATGLLAALQAAHDAGVVHRDVKPGNVMITPNGDVKVTDFGIARAASDQTITDTGMVVGTAQYLSPEQVSGKAVTPAADLYSVGAIIYEMLSGRKPFDGDTPLAVAMTRLTADPAPLRTVRPDIPEPLEQVVAIAMARSPENRYASADGMRRALESAMSTTTPARSLVEDPEPTQALAVDEIAGATVLLPRASDQTGVAPAAVVSERRRRNYRRLAIAAVLVALLLGVSVLSILAMTGGGADTVTVPRFVGMQRAAAEQRADQLGLTVRILVVPDSRTRGVVLTQDVPQGTDVARGETVRLTVSSGLAPGPDSVEVPDLQGMTKDEAEAVLRDLKLKIGSVTRVASTTVEEGRVVRTSPPKGTSLDPGDSVDIVLSSGPPPRKKRGKGRGGD